MRQTEQEALRGRRRNAGVPFSRLLLCCRSTLGVCVCSSINPLHRRIGCSRNLWIFSCFVCISRRTCMSFPKTYITGISGPRLRPEKHLTGFCRNISKNPRIYLTYWDNLSESRSHDVHMLRDWRLISVALSIILPPAEGLC